MTLDAKIEALLFYKTEPISTKKISEILEVSVDEILEAIKVLEEELDGRGVRLSINNDEVLLTTASEASSIIEKITKDELDRDLGKAGLETIAIILYKGEVTKSEIDYVRGVNSGFILRNLLIRGMIDKIPNPKDQRTYLYKPTFDLMNYMGVNKIEELPDYQKIQIEIEKVYEQEK